MLIRHLDYKPLEYRPYIFIIFANANLMDDLLRRLAPLVLKEGEFVFRSGRTSDHIIDTLAGYRDPAILNELADRLWDIVDKRTTCVVGYGVASIPLTSVISSRHGPHLTIVREHRKEYGTGQQIEAYLPGPSDCVSFIDSVFTTGSSFQEATKVIEPTGAQIIGYCVVANREEGDPSILKAPLRFLYTGREIREMYKRLRTGQPN